ncbi:uncharacterized protein BXZ73DRAFT_96285 [Epithele typhae]|uniref:uncharacterized protein n=1 Tax=Epithele typhae TaxID=378194 RepID=UPI002007C550|nr:uncharacterized protein BXZ73DRAFT_96285 [Epithele typhae]KAH9945299.1 hypothetical protein BXZ73DRAFT_96285 [Epithele typhae]
MPPRRQPARKAHTTGSALDPDVIAKRTKRHLDELERSNYAEPTGVPGAEGDEDDEEPGVGVHGGRTAKGRARRATISDKRQWERPGLAKAKAGRKTSMNVRTAVLYKKNLGVLVEESGIEQLPPSVPTYLRAAAPPPKEPPRLLCSVCGYWGKYKCKRCAMPYCDMNCEGVHNETRCERRVV